MDDATEHGSATGNDPGQVPREGLGRRTWVRSVALVGGGLVAGGILAGTLTANAAEDPSTSTPSVTQEDGTATDGTTAPEDCPEGSGPRGDAGTAPDQGMTPESGT